MAEIIASVAVSSADDRDAEIPFNAVQAQAGRFARNVVSPTRVASFGQ